ncbi:MAG: hypothetical protein HOH20_10040 [Rhodospirillaceae bacterium]|jgi:hypothetical protein|nr:hypothetical protein [Rhodospirillaceae bacterium]MBT5564110.1 hypothetical protein [Rhodospirillaceae bacterium]MBT6089906.1 hypothetical protein [Rhodospirillaceae bacterium]
MRDVDLETLLSLEVPAPDPARRLAARARALDAFEKTHRRGIGTAVARHLVRSSAPAWHLIADTLDSPWTVTVLRTATSLLALAMFCATIIAAFMLTS